MSRIIAPPAPEVPIVQKIRITIEIDPITGNQKLEAPANWTPGHLALVLSQLIPNLLAEDQKGRSLIVGAGKGESS
jgi:hypothetical protein